MADSLDLHFQIYKQANIGEEYIDIYSREKLSCSLDSPLRFVFRDKRDFTRTLEENVSVTVRLAMERGIISRVHHVNISELSEAKSAAFRYESLDLT